MGSELTLESLLLVMPTAKVLTASAYLPHIKAAMTAWGITTGPRQAAFLAQVAVETERLLYLEELWGPTPSQKRYEPPNDLAKKLGNTEKGDGCRYRGRGAFQLTGRFNYGAVGVALGEDFINNPDQLAQPQWAFKSAGWFFKTKGCNEKADRLDIDAISKTVNGGTNAIEERESYFLQALHVLTPSLVAEAETHCPHCGHAY